MLQKVQLFDFRCFSQFSFECSSHLTIISGSNGVGKTSLLEAIYHLSSFRSFRTREIQPLIREGAEHFVVRGLFADHQTVVIKKSQKSASTILLNDKPLNVTSVLAKNNPMTVVHQGLFELVDGGASARRSSLDWGLFHVEHRYHSLLAEYNHALKQRNALLKQGVRYREVEPWDIMLSHNAELLTAMREAYVDTINPYFQSLFGRCSGMLCSLDFVRGWGRKEQSELSLRDFLKTHFDQDIKQQTTRYGAHATDVRFLTERSAKKEFSRGQQKLLFFAFKLAQIALLQKPAIVLLDDVFAELDQEKRQLVMAELSNTNSQVIMTTPDPNLYNIDSIQSDYHLISLS